MRLLRRGLGFIGGCLLFAGCYVAIWCGERFYAWRSPEERQG